jgi:hypothetical protein
VGLPAGYIALMILYASVSSVQLREPRHWLPVWPAAAAIVLRTLSGASLRPWAHVTVGVALFLPTALTGYAFHREFVDGLLWARTGQIFFSPLIEQSVPVRYARSLGSDCTLMSNDPRVLILHGVDGLIYRLPTSSDQLRLLPDGPTRLCIVFFTFQGAASVERQRQAHLRVLTRLAADGAIRLATHDGVGEVWLSMR